MNADLPLLTSRQMADFVAQGFLRFDALVPAELNDQTMAQLRAGGLDGTGYDNEGISLDEFIPDAPGYGRVLRLPAVQGIIHSLVGPAPAPDHLAVHVVPARHVDAQFWHADAVIDPRLEAFDIQLFYYPHDTPREAGGTLFLPGSHFRRVHEATIARYQNISGQLPMVCPAGTVVVAHHGIWHCGQPNHTDHQRYMLKLRMNPRVRQRRLFDLSDVGDPQVMRNLTAYHPWPGAEIRLEYVQRLRLWRSLTGDASADTDLWLTRMDNEPTAEHRAARRSPEFANA